MLIDRTHLSWGIGTCVAALLSTGLYLWVFRGEEAPDFAQGVDLYGKAGGTPLGLFFGISAFVIFVFAGLLGWRRRYPALRVGRMQTWLRAHIWFTLLTFPLVFFHCDFHWGGPMTSMLMVLYLIVMVSGIHGLIVQQIMPRMMKEMFPEEVIYEQIPFIKERLVEEAEAALAVLKAPKKKAPVQAKEPAGEGDAEAGESGQEEEESEPPPPQLLIKFIEERVLGYLKAKLGLRNRLKDKGVADEMFRMTRVQMDEQWHPLLARMQQLVDERRLLRLQEKYQHWLHGWMLVHGPLSILLIFWTAWHAVVTVLEY